MEQFSVSRLFLFYVTILEGLGFKLDSGNFYFIKILAQILINDFKKKSKQKII
jgi:hypothetical protein